MSTRSAGIHIVLGLLLFILGGCAASTQQRAVSLNGGWRFAADAEDVGLDGEWFSTGADVAWRQVNVPHTWQVMEGLEGYKGIAWYRRDVRVAAVPKDCLLKLEFDAVYRDVQVWVDGDLVGEHKHSGWTPFAVLLDSKYAADGRLNIVLRVDNRFSEQALPYGSSFDWANDGGIIRGVRLRVLPKIHIYRLLVDAVPTDDFSRANVSVRVGVYSEAGGADVEAQVLDPSGSVVATMSGSAAGAGKVVLSATLDKPELWHFDRPALYTLACRFVKGGKVIHEQETAFGIRKVEVRDGYYWLNGEPMRLMGVEWMPGSDPRYGMAESPEYMHGILEDMKKLNCVISRFHWQQDESVFEFCDRNGMLFQEEIPTWGPATKLERLGDVQEQQMNEMMLAHYNHPSIYAWGLCNEIVGQQQRGHDFVQKGVEIAHSLDPHRLLTYASNSLQSTPGRDASRYVDFIEWNDYYDAWYGGGIPQLKGNLAEIAAALPDKSLVISEYGLCECSPKNPIGDARRIEMMKSHTDVYRKTPQIAGAIYFSYNDYRTHIGDKCTGAFQQRLHGVVDLMGRRKPSWEALRREASPIKTLAVNAKGEGQFEIQLVTRSLENDLPAYTLYDYDLIWTAYNEHEQPIAAGKVRLPQLAPGSEHVEAVEVGDNVVRVHAEVFRPTGYSVLDAVWEK